MPDNPGNDAAILEAVRIYWHLEHIPQVIEALLEHARLVCTAEDAARALLTAAEEFGSAVMLVGELEVCHGKQLKAHQDTWAAACKVQLPSRCAAVTMSIARSLWDEFYLKIIYERLHESAVTTQYENISFKRIFGGTSPKTHKGEIYLTDSKSCVHVNIDDRQVGIPGQTAIPTGMETSTLISICDTTMRVGHAQISKEPLVSDETPRVIYSYGPINQNDYGVRLDLIRQFCATLRLIKTAMNTAADFHKTNFKNKDILWEYMIRHDIKPTAFARHLLPYRKIEPHTAETALSRYREKQRKLAVKDNQI